MTFYTSPEALDQVGVYHQPNGQVVYLDLQYPLNTWCNASIKADADIAGPGTMLSFVVPAVMTVMIATIRAAFAVINDYSQSDDNTRPSSGHPQRLREWIRSVRVRCED